MNKLIYLIMAFAFCLQINLLAQSENDAAFFSSITAPVANKITSDRIDSKDRNELGQTAVVVYGVYRNLISTQDGSSCRFYPTCSAYFKNAVVKNGLVIGMVQTFDRLTRCNGLTPQKYEIDMTRRKLVDHVH